MLPPTLGQLRKQFSHVLVIWLTQVEALGYQFEFDQVTVPAIGSVHMPGSLHESGLAADILLFKNGVYLTDTVDYQAVGELWEQMGKDLSLDLAWGGRFTKPDGNHFSLRWEGKA